MKSIKRILPISLYLILISSGPVLAGEFLKAENVDEMLVEVQTLYSECKFTQSATKASEYISRLEKEEVLSNTPEAAFSAERFAYGPGVRLPLTIDALYVLRIRSLEEIEHPDIENTYQKFLLRQPNLKSRENIQKNHKFYKAAKSVIAKCSKS
jgi:hypothetical protein